MRISLNAAPFDAFIVSKIIYFSVTHGKNAHSDIKSQECLLCSGESQ